MTKLHLKRLSAERTWKISRKSNKFITRPKPGAHSFAEGMSLGTVIKDMLGYAKTTKEVKHIINNKDLMIDGRYRKNHRFLVGFMDIISFPKIKENFRMLLNKRGYLYLKKIDEKESGFKLSRITGKTIVKKKVQLNFQDGRVLLIDKNDYKVGDTLVLEIPRQKIKEHLKFETKAIIYLFSGRHVGDVGTLEEIKGKYIIFKNEKGDIFETLKKYAYVIGKNKAVIDTNENEPDETNKN